VTATTVERPTIHHFKPGTAYGVRAVAALFGRCDQWVRNLIARKKLAAVQLDLGGSGGGGPWLIDGSAVRVLYGSVLLDADLAGPPAGEQSEAEAVRRYQAKLDRLNGKGGTRR
jgi:hypothetical protein